VSERELVAVKVTDWTLFSSGQGNYWIKDLELAERAGLEKPRNIRSVITKPFDEGAVSRALAEGATKTSAIRVVQEVEVRGNRRGTQNVDTVYLNEDAAPLIAMRLRTQIAIELQNTVVRVEGVGWGWEALPIATFGDALSKLRSGETRADRALKATASVTARTPKQEQLGLNAADEAAR
jgi:hypothetical protein